MRFTTFLIIGCLLLSGCATAYDRQRQELSAAYQSGHITTDQYMTGLSIINQQQSAQMQIWQNAFSQAADNYKQSSPRVPYNSSPKQYDVYDQRGQQIGTATEKKPFPTVEEMDAAGFRPK